LLLAALTRDAAVRALKTLDQLRVAHAGADRLIAQSRRYAAESHKLITEANVLLERRFLLGADAKDEPACHGDFGPPAQRAQQEGEGSP
jgi:hypothetical protein